jgi:hypothetical protein
MKNEIKSFEGACKVVGISTQLPEVNALPEKHQKAIKAHYMLIIIAQALNEGWQPNWNDHNQYKYYPWFWMGDNGASPGVGFSYDGCGGDGTHSSVGSRLCYKSRELAKYAGTQFEALYKDYMLIE